MQPGRTPNWNIVAELESSAWLEAVQLASGDRLLLPAALRNRVSWCTPESSLPLLATIGPDGGVAVRPLSDQQESLKAIKVALQGAEPAKRASLTLAAMATYCRISLQPDGRLRLSPTLALHLCGVLGGHIWVGAHADIITLWSEKDWAQLLVQSTGALSQAMVDSLPG